MINNTVIISNSSKAFLIRVGFRAATSRNVAATRFVALMLVLEKQSALDLVGRVLRATRGFAVKAVDAM